MPHPTRWVLVFLGIYWALYKIDPSKYALVQRKYLSESDLTACTDGWYGGLFSGLKALVQKEIEIAILLDDAKSTTQEPLEAQFKVLEVKLERSAKTLAGTLFKNLSGQVTLSCKNCRFWHMDHCEHPDHWIGSYVNPPVDGWLKFYIDPGSGRIDFEKIAADCDDWSLDWPFDPTDHSESSTKLEGT